MRKLVFYISFAVLLIVLFSSTSLGEEESKDVLVRGIREAGKRKSNKGTVRKANRRTRKKVNRKKKNKQRKSKGRKAGNGSRKPRRKVIKKKRKGQKQRKFGKNAKKKVSRSGRQNTFCPTEKATALKLLYNQVSNFKKQLKRAKNHANIVKNKKSKKDSFAKDAAILTDVVGGNLTKPTCSAKGRSASSAAGHGSTLSSCSSTISSSCPEITINTTLTGACSDTMDSFESKVTTCRTDDSCTCWTEAFNMKSDITKCKASDEADAVKAKKKACLSTFSDCKKAQDSAVQYTATCPAQTSSATTMGMGTTKSARRRNLVEKFLARNLIKRNHQTALKA